MDDISLDESLTSIQWLCQLDSNKFLDDDVVAEKSQVECQAPVTTAVCHQANVEKNPHNKPHYSYATLIVFAINSSMEKRMTLQEIYAWIQENYPFYKFAKKGWKNSIRHNLSLHKFFIKEKRPSVLHGKGSFWRISPEGKENLMRDLLKQSHISNNMQLPYTMVPHDPNRKLRPIMPKPNGEEFQPSVRYVPLLTCTLPVVFVPRPALSSGTMDTGVPMVGTHKEQPKMIEAPTETTTTVVQSSTGGPSLNESTNNEAKLQSDVMSTVPPQTINKSQTHAPVQNDNSASQVKDEMSGLKPTSSETSTKSKKLPNILRRKRKSRVRSPEAAAKVQAPRRAQTPQRLQPTLAAINSHHSISSPKRSFDELVSSLTELTSSPLRHNSSFDFLNSFGSPGFSPLRSPGRFGGTQLTPHDTADSHIMVTPLKGGLGDLSFNWTPFKTGFTPLMTSPPNRQPSSSCGNSQGCRKSLGLE